jgi:hypothetical protein
MYVLLNGRCPNALQGVTALMDATPLTNPQVEVYNYSLQARETGDTK